MTTSDLQNSSLWSLAWSDTVDAPTFTLNGQQYTEPFPSISCPILFTNRLLIVECSCTVPTGRNWKTAGNLKHYQTYPIGGNNQNTQILKTGLPLNQYKLVLAPSYASQYSVVIEDAYWLLTLAVNIYEFTGNLPIDSNFASIESALTTIQNSLNTLVGTS